MEVKKIRDLSLITLNKEKVMVIACDSCGGVGMKENDVLKVPSFYVGKFAARVALLEVICSGAEVITVTDAVCNEMEPTAGEIIRGIKEELKIASIDNIVLTGSTEENFTTTVTALGITVIGIADTRNLKVNAVKEESILISIGLPKVGNEIDLIKDDEIISYEYVKMLLGNDFVYEIVPVGSKGIAYEAELLAVNNKFRLDIENEVNIDINKSGGPATCAIAAVNPKGINEIINIVPNVNIIGYLRQLEK